MYPAEGFGTVDDLPDSINYTDAFSSFTLTKVEPFSYGGMMVYYVSDLELERYLGVKDEPIFNPGDCQNPDQTLGWEGGTGLNQTTSCCLIQGLSFPEAYITDNFADTYTISAPNSFPTTVTRVSLCLWEGVDACGNKAYLSYGEFPGTPYPGAPNAWAASIEYYVDLVCEGADGRTINEKSGTQDTPIGTYLSVPGQPVGQTITVS